MKKCISILLALLLVLSLNVTAFANGETAEATKNDSITITGAKAGETYKLYKLFDLKVDSETAPTAYSYTVNSDWANFFKAAEGETPAGPGNQYVTINEAGYVTAISNAAALAKAAAEWSGKPDAAKTVTVVEGETTAAFSELDDGYWLITSSLGTIAMTDTTPDKNAVTIAEKNPEDTVIKHVMEDSTGDYGTENDAQIGDTVEFKSIVTLYPGTRSVVVHDEMDSGLTFTAGSVAIADLAEGTDYSVNENPDDDCTFEITFADSYIAGLTAITEVTITYSAVLNENAISSGEDGVAIVEQKNTARVAFGDSQSAESQTTTTTHKFSVFKFATGETTNLAGAVFELQKAGTVMKLTKLDNNNYRVDPNGTETTFVTVADGDIVIWGVDSDGDYSLHETEAPSGYNVLTSDVNVTVNANNSTRSEIENKTGAELPHTGGIGTTLFYVIGGLMAAGAAVVLIAKKRTED